MRMRSLPDRRWVAIDRSRDRLGSRFPGVEPSEAHHLLPTEIMTVLSHTSAIELSGSFQMRTKDADEVRSVLV